MEDQMPKRHPHILSVDDGDQLMALRALNEVAARRQAEQANLISFLVRVLTQHHGGEATIRVDAPQPPVRFQFGPVEDADGKPTGEMFVRVVEAEDGPQPERPPAPLLAVPHGAGRLVVPGQG